MTHDARYTHLDNHDRTRIELRLRDGWSPTSIAAELGRAHTTILRELNRTGGRWTYTAAAAQRLAAGRRRGGQPRRLDTDTLLTEIIVHHLEDGRSVDQALHLIAATGYPTPSKETVYQWMYNAGDRPGGEAALAERARKAMIRPRRRRKPRTRARNPHHGRIPGMTSFRERPTHDRDTFGHWEGDLVIGKNGRSAVATLVERRTRYTIALNLPGRTADVLTRALRRLIRSHPAGMFQSITWDQGKEAAGHARVTQTTQVPFFFADAHSPWQRGTNENTNGVLRRKLPRGTDLSTLTSAAAAALSAWLNGRPMPTLSWSTPQERFDNYLRALQSGQHRHTPEQAADQGIFTVS